MEILCSMVFFQNRFRLEGDTTVTGDAVSGGETGLSFSCLEGSTERRILYCPPDSVIYARIVSGDFVPGYPNIAFLAMNHGKQLPNKNLPFLQQPPCEDNPRFYQTLLK